jgi:hypothetical protein
VPERLPFVFTRAEVKAILSRMTGTNRLIAGLLYGPSDVKTIMIYTHILNRRGRGVFIPLDS